MTALAPDMQALVRVAAKQTLTEGQVAVLRELSSAVALPDDALALAALAYFTKLGRFQDTFLDRLQLLLPPTAPISPAVREAADNLIQIRLGVPLGQEQISALQQLSTLCHVQGPTRDRLNELSYQGLEQIRQARLQERQWLAES